MKQNLNSRRNQVVLTFLACLFNPVTGFAADNTLETQYFDETSRPTAQFRAAPSVGILAFSGGELTTYGGGVGVGFRVSNQIELGVEVSYLTASIGSTPKTSNRYRSSHRSSYRYNYDYDYDYDYDSSSSSAAADLTLIPVTFTSLFRLSTGSVQPYLGTSVGVSFNSVSVSSGEDSVGMDGVGLVLQARAGVEFQVAKNFSLFGEAKGGILNSAILFSPQVGVALNL